MKREDAQAAFEASCDPEQPAPQIPSLSKKKFIDPKPKRRRIKRRKKTKMGTKGHLLVGDRPREKSNDKISPGQRLLLQKKAFSLRYEDGKTYEDIGKAMGVSTNTAFQYVLSIWKDESGDLDEKKEQVRRESVARYDQALSRWIPLLLNTKVRVEEIKRGRDGEEYVVQLPEWQMLREATDAIAKLLRQKEQLYGLHDTASKKTPEAIGEGLVDGMMQSWQKWINKREAPPIEAEVISTTQIQDK